MTTGTMRTAAQLVPASQSTGAVSNASWEPLNPCPQKNTGISPSSTWRAISATTASSPSGTPSTERWIHTRRATPSASTTPTSTAQRSS
jgi:hypothetical protein